MGNVGAPFLFDLALPGLTLEAGSRLEHHHVRGWCWGQETDAAAVRARRPLSPTVPTVLIVHALTGDARAGGPEGWWEPLIGPGRVLDPQRMRLLCFNLLGSCYGSSGPVDADFPSRPGGTPATLTTWDQARSLLLALDALGVRELALCTGGSLGAMVALCVAALAPGRVERLAPIAGAAQASSWVVGFNHVAREVLRMDPGFPRDVRRGLDVARQLAMLTYRAEPALEVQQGRQLLDGWGPEQPYRVQTYLKHQGEKLVRRFDGRSYLALLDAMDHHDLSRPPPLPEPQESWRHGPSWGLSRIQADVLAVGIDTDVLFLPHHMARLVDELRGQGRSAEVAHLTSPHGHDAFLIEWDQMAALLSRSLPPGLRS
ncbi:homoserine O-acetyltransferase family protein [Hyalangium versicolor]|uniref:homoserine O-acetyltransferase family protein n=1 Tax=Hyalangium versicolor TaxID=2861190 RepID=UPI001CC98681|nr:alpha/beta fold hydrolase [Hyalangium versicolor]